MPKANQQIIEKLAAIEHERWSGWQKWCHKILRKDCGSPELEVVLERWDRQIVIPYKNLSEKEKQSDRDQVMRYWPLIEKLMASQESELKAQWRKEIEKLATCSDCKGMGFNHCSVKDCSEKNHKCSRCFGTGEVEPVKEDILKKL